MRKAKVSAKAAATSTSTEERMLAILEKMDNRLTAIETGKKSPKVAAKIEEVEDFELSAKQKKAGFTLKNESGKAGKYQALLHKGKFIVNLTRTNEVLELFYS
jgi:hypothetical protein